MIVPGSVSPLLLAQGGDPLDELGKINRSLRLRASVSAFLSRTFGTPTANTVFALSCWIKRGALANCSIFSGGTQAEFYLESAGKLHFFVNGALDQSSAAVERDPAAHGHLHVRSTGSVIEAYLNGALILSYSGTMSGINSATQHRIGSLSPTGGDYFDGLFSQYAFVDGQAPMPSAFVLTHPRTGQLRPRTPAAIRAAVAAGGGARNGWGANGCFLPFELADFSGATVYDRSQSDTDTTGNNWTLTNINVTTAGLTFDSMLDTPTNNYAMLNPLMPVSALNGGAIFNGNLSISGTYGGATAGTLATIPCVIPTWWEVEAVSNSGYGQACIGVSLENFASTLEKWAGVGGSYESYGVYGVAFDPKTGNGWIKAPSGTWITGDPELGGAPTFSVLPSKTWFPLCAAGRTSLHDNTPFAHYNFGQRPFSYVPPAGFKALCTKNLPYPAIPKSYSAFVAVTDTGANILSTLAAAESWSNYIRIVKRRDASEGWRWMFSDDPTNYLDSAGTTVKAAIPAFSGTSYVGYSLRVSAANGVATGRLNHASGTPDVIADGLANSRKVVMLRAEAGGPWFLYHPDCTAGKLLYLNTTDGETPDSTISSVTASGFTVAAALTSGWYRWIALAEVDGFLKLGKHTGTGAADGPFDQSNFSPAFTLFKRTITTGGFWDVVDTKRDPNNGGSENQLFPQSTAAEDDSPLLDLISSGIKVRSSGGTINLSGDIYIFVAIAAFPFRYANAR